MSSSDHCKFSLVVSLTCTVVGNEWHPHEMPYLDVGSVIRAFNLFLQKYVYIFFLSWLLKYYHQRFSSYFDIGYFIMFFLYTLYWNYLFFPVFRLIHYSFSCLICLFISHHSLSIYFLHSLFICHLFSFWDVTVRYITSTSWILPCTTSDYIYIFLYDMMGVTMKEYLEPSIQWHKNDTILCCSSDKHACEKDLRIGRTVLSIAKRRAV